VILLALPAALLHEADLQWARGVEVDIALREGDHHSAFPTLRTSEP
jgi:hypothetical protein